MDDLIVIILTLIIAVVGALGQIKKRKPQQQQNNQNNNKSNSGGFWDFLEEQTDYMQRPQENYTPEENIEEEPAAMPEKVEEKPAYEFEAKNEGMSVYKMKTPEEIQKDAKKKQKGKKVLERFSLRKAVIYSEILNRKYD